MNLSPSINKNNPIQYILVVSNIEMLRDADNLFKPKFVKRTIQYTSDTTNVFKTWYESVKRSLINENLIEFRTEISSKKITNGTVNLQKCHVETIQTKSLRNHAIAIETNETDHQLKLANDFIEKTVQNAMENNDDNENDQMLSATFQGAIEPDLDSHETIDELIIEQSFGVRFINGQSIDDLIKFDENRKLRKLIVDRLILLNQTERVKEIFHKLHPPKMRANNADENLINNLDDIARPLKIRNLFVRGRLNQFEWANLLENTLRTNAVEQRLSKATRIDAVSARKVHVTSGIISNRTLANLVSIRSNETFIDQEIRFTHLLSINDFHILDRMNQINIENSQFDVLLKRSRNEQIITGQKIFEAIHMREPILQQGKIVVRSSVLNRVKPIVTVNEDINLIGDYSISGNLTILENLMAKNVFGQSGRYSVEQVLMDGLRVNETNIDIPIVFGQPIKARNIVSGTKLNGLNINHLVRRNVDTMQVIRGQKNFLSDLHILDGIGEALVINDIELDNLDKNTLKTSMPNQTIIGTIHFRNILVHA